MRLGNRKSWLSRFCIGRKIGLDCLRPATAEFLRISRDFRAIVAQLVLVIASFGDVDQCIADLPSPRLDVINPVGASAGATVEMTIVGPDLEAGDTLLFDHPGFQAEFVKEKTFKVSVSKDVPAGTFDIRVAGRFGVSNPRLFAVCHGLTDVAEVEPNNSPAQAQSVAINSAISNHRDGNFHDFFRVPLQSGQRMIVDCQCARLDTEFDPVLFLYSAEGTPLASNSDYTGRDPLLDFTAPLAGDYVIEVRDLRYTNGAVYRLLIHDRPQVENVFPRAVQAGKTEQLTAFGRNLPGGQPSSWKIGEVPLQQAAVSFSASVELSSLGGFRFLEHPNHFSVLPTAATCTLVGDQFAPLGANPQTMVISSGPTTIEQEPNNSKDQPQKLTLPAVLSGRFDQPRDADWYEFETDETGGNYGFDVYSERIAGRADPFLALYDKDGNRIFELDDFGHRINAFDGHLRDPAGQTNLQPKQRIRVVIQDRYQRGGARYHYVLSIRKAQPDFFIAAIHGANNMQGTTVWQGGSNFIDLVAHHVDGGNAFPITVTAEGLPSGLHAIPTLVNNDNRASMVFWADENAAPWTGPVKLWAEQKQGDKTLRREVRPYIRPHQQQGTRPTRGFQLAVREKAPYGLTIEPEKITVEAGKPAELKLKLKRHWPEFQGPVNFIPLNFPGFLQLGNGTVQQDETIISITVQQGTRPGDYTVAVMGQAQVPYNKDPAAKDRPNTLVQLPSRPVTITVTEPAKK